MSVLLGADRQSVSESVSESGVGGWVVVGGGKGYGGAGGGGKTGISISTFLAAACGSENAGVRGGETSTPWPGAKLYIYALSRAAQCSAKEKKGGGGGAGGRAPATRKSQNKSKNRYPKNVPRKLQGLAGRAVGKPHRTVETVRLAGSVVCRGEGGIEKLGGVCRGHLHIPTHFAFLTSLQPPTLS
jgi:hypothetical protein